MVSLTYMLGLVLSAAAATPQFDSELPSCGEVNIFMTFVSIPHSTSVLNLKCCSGLPPYHPHVISLGLDPGMVDRKLREDAARIVSMGYNLKGQHVIPYSPELADRISCCCWSGGGLQHNPPRRDERDHMARHRRGVWPAEW
jgi:hypothetical protein